MEVESNISLSVDEKTLKNFLSKQNEKLRTVTQSAKEKGEIKLEIPKNYKYLPYIDSILDQMKSGNYHQFTSLYISRLNRCKSALSAQAKLKWPQTKITDNILDLKGTQEQIIIGISYKEMPLKPSVLKGVENMIGISKIDSFVSKDKDTLSFEDSSGRIKINSSLSTCLDIGHFISGIPMCLKGRLDEKGLFVVNDYEFYASPINSLNKPEIIEQDDKDLVLILSNLEIGKTDTEIESKMRLTRNLLIDFIQNRNNTNEKFRKLSERLSRVIICGDSVFSPEDAELVVKGSYMKQEINTRIYNKLLADYEEFDKFIHLLSSYISVDILPGPNDISTSYFPDLELISQIFSECTSQYNKTLHLVPNPCYFIVNSISIIGTSGNNINNIKQYTTFEKSIDIMENTLKWGHLAPSAPDTLRTYPYEKDDPLIIKEIPDVYFCGEQKQFESKTCAIHGKKVLLFTVPKFCESGTGVIFNIKTKQVELISFKC